MSKSIKMIYYRINEHLSKHAMLYFFIGILLGIAIGILITYLCGLQVGPTKIWHNGSGLCIGSC